jgi:hypothetical protein
MRKRRDGHSQQDKRERIARLQGASAYLESQKHFFSQGGELAPSGCLFPEGAIALCQKAVRLPSQKL